MHDTLSADVKGNIDKREETEKSNVVAGWAFHQKSGLLPLRVKIVDEVEADLFDETVVIKSVERLDVIKFYGDLSLNLIMCGWVVTIPKGVYSKLEMQIGVDQWIPVFAFNEPLDKLLDMSLSGNKVPTFLVVDNFYQNPDSVRAFALKQTFNYNPNYHKGKRTDKTYRFPGLKERFEDLLGCSISNWDNYPVSGCFQYCIAGDQLVYHSDLQQYAGVLFLTPDAPPNTGTCFLRSKNTKQMKTSPGDYPLVYPHGHLDPCDFDVVDVVGNIYNRLVLFDAKLIHAASCYFGNSVENGRLFQLFFFDL